MKAVRLNIGGIAIDAETVDFKPVEEPWSTYRLDDGGTIKIKLVVSGVFKLSSVDPITGFPQYVVQSGNVMSVEPPTPKREMQ